MFKITPFIVRFIFVAIAICPSITCLAERSEGDSSRFRYVVQYATYLGGEAWDQAREVIPYPDGTVLIGAMSASANMPTTADVVQPKYAGDDPSLGHGGVIGGDGYLVRISADGSEILAATCFGGSKQERGVYGMLLDSQGNIVISSATRSPDMPTTEGAYQTRFGGPDADMYTAKLSADLKEILWCTYFGGSGNDLIRSVALGPNGEVYLVVSTTSRDFPVTANAVQPLLSGNADAFIVKLVPKR